MLRVQTVSAMMLTLACACAAPVAADLEANESDATKTVSRFENFGGSGTLLWQGFSHEWKNLQHRMGDISNYVDRIELERDKVANEVNISAAEHFTFLPGQDGDIGFVQTYYSGFANERIGVTRGSWDVFFEDEADMSRVDEQARTSISQTVTINIDNNPHNYGANEKYEVVLGGFEIDLTNPENGETGYIWARDLSVDVDDCTVSNAGTQLVCTLSIEVVREDAPDTLKGSTEEIAYHFRVHYAAISAKGDQMATREREWTVQHRSLDLEPASLSTTISGKPNYERSMIGVKGFSWEIDTDDIKDGRYLRVMDFHVEGGGYDKNTGEKEVDVTLGVKQGPASNAGNYSASLRTVLLQFKGATYGGLNGSSTYGEVCIVSGVGLPNCGGDQRNSGTVEIDETMVP